MLPARRQKDRLMWLVLLGSVTLAPGCVRTSDRDESPAGETTGEAESSSPPDAPASPPAGSKDVSTSPPSGPPETEMRPTAEPSTAARKAEGAPAASPLEPDIIEVTVPEGTILELELLTALDTSVNRVGDEIQARTMNPVYVKGEPVLPKGSYVEGRVTEVQASGKVKGTAKLGFTFDRLSTRTGVQNVRTSFVEQEAESRKKKDAAIIGGGAGVGAIVGGIIGGKKGAAIGATIGGAGGTGVVLATKGDEIRLPVGTEVNIRLEEPVVLPLN